MIKKIHYCWFGGSVPNLVSQQVASWQRLCPDYEIYEWNDQNADFSQFDFWNRMKREKRYGFASDIASFSKVYEEGGFYMDCDVELKKSWDELPAPADHLIFGYMYDFAISGGVFYAPAKHPLMEKLLDYYQDISPTYYPVNNTIMTHLINNNVHDFKLNGRFYQSDEYKLTIFPKEYLCQPSFIKSKPFAVDQFAGSWKNAGKEFIANRGDLSYFQILKRKLSIQKMLMHSEFQRVYLNALIGRKLQCQEHWRTCYHLKGGAIVQQ